MKVLCVAEKNSIARNVATILGGSSIDKTRSSGYTYVKNYDFRFNGFPFTTQTCEVTMTSVAGHLCSLDFHGERYGWGRCNSFELFDAPLRDTMSKDQQLIANNIRREARFADVVIIWTDCDREGEYIGWEIYSEAKKANRNLDDAKLYRAVFSHLERTHIVSAARNLGKLDMKSVDAVSTRIELDLRTGVSFTRLLTDTMADKIQANRPRPSNEGNNKRDKVIVSYGPCQFPTLGFVVDRQMRIKNFVPEEFWYIQLQLDDDLNTSRIISSDTSEKITTFQWERGHLYDRLAVLTFYEICLELAGNEAKVIDLRSKPSVKYRPFPLTTVELQKNCSRFFKMNAKQSLAAAEKLYQKGFISYPRTETDIFPDSMNLKELIEKQASDNSNNQPWSQFAKDLLNETGSNRFRQPRKGKHDDKAHPPIYPIISIGRNVQLDANEKKVYEYVVRHFLACCSEDAKGQTTTITLDWAGERFKSTGLMVLERNFLDVYPWAKWEDTKRLPELHLNQDCCLSKAEMKSGFTSEPKPMTESELIMLMDANGIGTDATIADHIEKIQTRNYVMSLKMGKEIYLKPTELGVALVHAFEEIGLEDSFSKPFQRREMEEDLKKICQGEITKPAVLEDIIEKYRSYYIKTNSNRNKLLDVYARTLREMSVI